MNLAAQAYASETSKCDGKSTQQNQGIVALNVGRKKGEIFCLS